MAQPKSKSSSASSSKSKSSRKPVEAATSKKVTASAAAKPAPATTTTPVFAKAAPVVAAPVAPVAPAAPVRELSRGEFLELVRKEAYRRATRRNFKNGSPMQDWLNAEAAVSGKLAAEGVRLS